MNAGMANKKGMITECGQHLSNLLYYIIKVKIS